MTKIHVILLKLFALPAVKYNKMCIDRHSIHAFDISSKRFNDENNKMRESIVGAIINNKLPNDYFIMYKWHRMKRSIDAYLHRLLDVPFLHVECKHMGGRKYNYDFDVLFHVSQSNEKERVITRHVELKFNADTVSETPQFVSPMKPSQYLSQSYEEYFYDTHLETILSSTPQQQQKPPRDIYLSQIHSTCPPCMKPFQDMYYSGCPGSSRFSKSETDIAFYNLCKSVSKDSIEMFIESTDIDIELLSTYLRNSQQDKMYMLYSTQHNRFVFQSEDVDNFTITSVVKNAKKSRYECITKTGKKINVLLRWKNGNGIAFPAFQIS